MREVTEKRPASLLLFDILESINKIENYTRDITIEQLMQDELNEGCDTAKYPDYW
jgi:uncharacterized protein with HEPN domain